MRIKDIDGLPVIDAKHPLSVTVTKRDIARADPKRPETCAVARACMRELSAIEVRVHLSRVYLRTNDHNWVRYITPAAMRDELVAFDRGGTFEPATFALPIPPKSAALGKTQGGKKTKRRTQPKTKRQPPHVLTNVRTGPAQ